MPPKNITSYFKPAPASPTAALAATRKRASDTAPTREPLADVADRAAAIAPPAKKTKTAPPKAAPKATKGKVPKTSATQSPTIKLLKATSRAELRASLEEHPDVLSLLELELDTLGEDWLIALQDELTKPYFLDLKKHLKAEKDKKAQVFPPADDIYSWSRFCALKDVRVIIVGQDPYHDDGQAHGLAFSVRKGVKIPPSLRNIYKELAAEYPSFVIPTHGDLTEWAEHGVLLLNTALTVRAHSAGSHSAFGWDLFTGAALRAVTEHMAGSTAKTGANGLVLMAWGAHAQKMIATLDTKRHLVLKSGHPSPLSVRFFTGNDHFKKANEWLLERYGKGGAIDWKSFGAK